MSGRIHVSAVVPVHNEVILLFCISLKWHEGSVRNGGI